jgi:hypothetical protein
LAIALVVALDFKFVNGFPTANAAATAIYTHTMDVSTEAGSRGRDSTVAANIPQNVNFDLHLPS